MLYLRASTAMVLPVLVDVVMPVWLLEQNDGRFGLGVARVVGVPLILLGVWLLFDSVFLRFAHEGRGTLAPIDPPQFVVRSGAYRLMRNPMYVANVTILVGAGVLFGSWRLLAWTGVAFVAFHLFAVLYEEPALTRRFGEDYLAYRRDVGRWVPRRPA